MKSRILLINLAILLLPIIAHAQQEADNQFNIKLDMLTRAELRYGGFNELDNAQEDLAHFVIGRYRLSTDYSRSWLQVRLSLQQSGTWGMGGGSFSLNEGWAMVKSRKGLFAKIGRQALAYDDERIIGSNDWAMTAPTHDVLKLGYEGNQHKVHLLFAYNQNPENMGGFTFFSGGN